VTWVFVFLGEFGYELFNWQGRVRRFAATLGPGERLVCCSRGEVAPLYERADAYVENSGVPAFQESVASGYFAVAPGGGSFLSPRNLLVDQRVRRAIRRYVRDRLGDDSFRFVFSSGKTELRGCELGASRRRFGRDLYEGDIYERLDVTANDYERIEPDESRRPEIEAGLGLSLDTPYVLCQARERPIVRRSADTIVKVPLLEELAQRLPVVLLSFDTGRAQDSFSSFAEIPGCRLYSAGSFGPQSTLVAHARRCVFFTEGDFGSHVYVPPFLGRDVVVVAPASVYRLGTTPIAFWNENVFHFGGQIVALEAEEALASPSRVAELAHELTR
jgi:hypothetical protein